VYDDQEHERRMARNQAILMVIMTLFLLGYFFWSEMYGPKTPPKPAVQTAQQQQQAQQSAAPTAATPGEAPAPANAWVKLPAPPEKVDPAADTVTLEDGDLRLVFTKIGARLKTAEVLLGEKGSQPQQLVPSPPANVSDVQAEYPLSLSFSDPALDNRLNHVRWDVAQQTPKSVTFRLDLPGVAEIRKEVSFADAPHVINLRVFYANRETAPRSLSLDETPSYILYWGPDIVTGEISQMMPKAVVWRANDQNDTVPAAKVDVEQPRVIPGVEWIADKSAYFTVAMKPEFPGSKGWAQGSDPTHYRFGLTAPSVTVAPGTEVFHTFRLYLGPSHLTQLKKAWDTLPTIQRFYGTSTIGSAMNAFAVFLLKLLNGFYSVIPNYGIAIILLTVLVRLAVFPLTVKQIRSMKRMQLLAPEMEELKQKHADDPQELNKRMMELYRERGVSPLGGCMPLLVQMPVFFALYKMLSTAFELRGAPFMLWITDLSQPDKLLHMPFMLKVPVVGPGLEYLNLLPILMALSMVVSQKVMPMTTPSTGANAQQMKVIMNIMPVMFSVFCYNLASGLCLYILVSTVLGIAQQAFTRTITVDAAPPKRRVPRKRQHFYTAAKARQRRQQKEIKQGKRHE
jgi:YidC/Oxa1 family membrane protein insertase